MQSITDYKQAWKYTQWIIKQNIQAKIHIYITNKTIQF